ncbi:MAG TPA: hypothetical protein VFY45_06790, partial [Baekduia sp.]|nr:hypothetical protein [Baekduia sp.]
MRISRGRVARGAFPPHEVAQVKAIACELPTTHGVPLSRFSRSELHRFVIEQAVSEASASTIGRWLSQDAIKPWQQRSWIFPRDPKFLQRAGPILDLYAGRWEGKLLEPGDRVISADAKPSIQARKRIHPGAPPAPGRGQLVEHEYERNPPRDLLALQALAGAQHDPRALDDPHLRTRRAHDPLQLLAVLRRQFD